MTIRSKSLVLVFLVLRVAAQKNGKPKCNEGEDCIIHASTHAPHRRTPLPTAWNTPSPVLFLEGARTAQGPATAPPSSSGAIGTTLVPTRSGGLAPTIVLDDRSLNCTTIDGEYGSSEGSADVIKYGYELEIDLSFNASLREDVLPSLEQAFTQALLPSLFQEACGEVGDRRRRRFLSVIGISSSPHDEPDSNVICSGEVDDGNECRFTRGSLTIYEEKEGSHDETELLAHLAQAMRDGLFDKGVHESIVRVRYVDLNPQPSREDPSTEENFRNKGFVRIAAAVIATLILLIGFCLYCLPRWTR